MHQDMCNLGFGAKVGSVLLGLLISNSHLVAGHVFFDRFYLEWLFLGSFFETTVVSLLWEYTEIDLSGEDHDIIPRQVIC